MLPSLQPWVPPLPSFSAVRKRKYVKSTLSPLSPLPSPSLFLLFTALGAAYGTAKSGTGIAAMSVMRPDLIMKSVIPVVMAGIIAIYGLVVSVLIGNGRKPINMIIKYMYIIIVGSRVHVISYSTCNLIW